MQITSDVLCDVCLPTPELEAISQIGGDIALRVTPLFDFGCVAPRSHIAEDMLSRHALPKPKIDSHAASPIYEMAWLC
jgi:hypothetical protein